MASLVGRAFRVCRKIARMRFQKLLSCTGRPGKKEEEIKKKSSPCKRNGRDIEECEMGQAKNMGINSSPPLDIVQELEEVFKRFDANGDGKISVSELGAVMNSLGDELKSDEELEMLVKEVDSDGDGFIDLQEFIDFNRKSEGGVGSLEELRDAFRVFDMDRNGYISAEELQTVLASMGDNSTLEDCFRMIRGVDSDGDGFVDFEEFRKMMTASSR